MTIRRILTSLKFTATQWDDVVRCAARDTHHVSDGSFYLDQLEARVLYSASPVPVEIAQMADAEQAAESLSSDATSVEDQFEDAAILEDEYRTTEDTFLLLDELGDTLLLDAQSDQQQTHELVFIDESAADYEQLLADFGSERDDGRVFEIFVIDSSSNGLAQITEYLSERQDVDAVHIVSHGTDRALKLGNLWLTTENRP